MTSRAHWIAHDRRRRILHTCRSMYPDLAPLLVTWRNHGRQFVAGYPVHACIVGYFARDEKWRVVLFAATWSKLESTVARAHNGGRLPS